MRFRANFERVPLIQRPRCFLDLETTGLKAGYHEITEIGVIHEKLGKWSCRIRPRYMSRADPESLEIHGYNNVDWDGAPYFEGVAKQIIEYLENTILIGHNIAGFDIPFLHGNFEMAELSSEDISRSVMDTMTLAIEHLVPKGLKQLRLHSVCDFLKISNEGEHTALADAERVKQVWEKLVGNQLKLF